MAKHLGYSNDLNPFGDSNLLQPFVWGKKKEKDKYENKQVNLESDKKRSELISEIEKVRKRRSDREKELAEIERLRDEEQRLREASQYGDWQKKEEIFALEQTQQRSKIRLADNREKPIDLIAKNILLVEAAKYTAAELEDRKEDMNLLDLEGELRNPIDIITSLNILELKQLSTDINVYLQLELSKSGPYVGYWQSLLTIADVHTRKLSSDTNTNTVHQSIERDVEELLRGKTMQQLDDLQHDIDKSLREGKQSDVEYWEQLKAEVLIQRAKAVIQDIHVKLLEQQFDLLSRIRSENKTSSKKTTLNRSRDQQMSGSSSNSRRGVEITIEEEDDTFASSSEEAVLTAFELAEQEEKMEIGDEIMLPGTTTYWWQDKYRPRKPRYFNKVKTGWDRTKYNLTHYDHDNPPPKMIQGYKFTVFYPDLIDKNKTPRYFIEACAEDAGGKEFVIIRFHAGAPYEDVAFKIINREWDIHRRSGFLCVFDRGVLQLNFNFKRSFYRR